MAVDNTIQSLLHVDMIVPVETKPTPNESTMNKLYLVPETDPQTDDEYHGMIVCLAAELRVIISMIGKIESVGGLVLGVCA